MNLIIEYNCCISFIENVKFEKCYAFNFFRKAKISLNN